MKTYDKDNGFTVFAEVRALTVETLLEEEIREPSGGIQIEKLREFRDSSVTDKCSARACITEMQHFGDELKGTKTRGVE